MAGSTSTSNQKTDTHYGSNTSSSGGSTSTTKSHTEGGSTSTTVSQSNTKSQSQGGANQLSYGKSYASGQVADKTQAQFDRFGNDYVQSGAVASAYDNLQAALSGKPTFQSKYEDKLSGLYDQIMNRDKFSYNFNEDAMYNLYKDQFTQQGKTAMQDTMGQAAAMTGGYGSSYAQSVGQQTYQQYLRELNNMIPELRQQAYQEYQAEGQDLLNKYNITNQAYNNEYGQYRDAVSDYQADRSFDYGMYADERNFDYNQFSDNRNYWQNEYWQERNAEQSNIQNTDQTNWNEAQSQTNSWSQTNSEYWEDTTSTTNTSNWNNSSTSGWESSNVNNVSTSMPLGGSGGSGGGSSAFSSNARKGMTDKWSSYSAASSNERKGFVEELAKQYQTDKEEVNDALKNLYVHGTDGSQGQKITFDKNDIASLYRSILAYQGDKGSGSYTNNDIMKLLGIR